MTHFPFVSPHGSWDLSNWQRAKSKDVIKAKDYQRLSRDIPATESWALVAFFHSPRNPPGGLKLIWKKINHGAASILHMFTLFFRTLWFIWNCIYLSWVFVVSMLIKQTCRHLKSTASPKPFHHSHVHRTDWLFQSSAFSIDLEHWKLMLFLCINK